MTKKWSDDAFLLSSVAANLTEALAFFPKSVIKPEQLTRDFKMPLSHIQVLIMLSSNVLSIGALSEKMAIAKPNITPLVNILCDKGLVQRVRSSNDRRVVTVCLTDNGQAMLSRIRASIASQITEWQVQLSRSEAKELNVALSTMLRVARTIAME